MCKSFKDGGERCDADIAKSGVKLASELQEKVKSHMSEKDRAYADSQLAKYDNMTKIHADFTPAIPYGVNKAINEKVEQHPSVKSAKKKMEQSAEDYRAISQVAHEMASEGEPSTAVKQRYGLYFDKEYQEIHREIDGLVREGSRNGADINVLATKLDPLTKKLVARAETFNKITPEEAYGALEKHPAREKMFTSATKFANEEKAIRDHYRKEELYNNHNQSYKDAYNKFAQTEDGTAHLRKIAENKLQSQSSSQSLKAMERRVEQLEVKGADNQAIQSAKNTLTLNTLVRNGSQFTHKYAHVKKMMMEGKDVEKDLVLPTAGDDVITVQTKANYAKSFKEAEREFGANYADLPVNERNRNIASDLYRSKKIVHVEGLKSNPRLQKSLETLDENFSNLRDRMVGSLASALARKHTI